MTTGALKPGMVRGISKKAGRFEVAVALGADQWAIAQVDAGLLAACKLAIGAPVLVDTATRPFTLKPWQAQRPAEVREFSRCRP